MTRRQPTNYDLVEDLTTNIAHAARIERLIHDWEGPSSSSGTGTHGNVANSNPVEAAIINGPTPTTRLLDAAHAHLNDLHQLRVINARMNTRRHSTLNLLDHDQAKTRINERTTPSTIGFCEGCDRSVNGTTEYEQLKGGLCGACRQALTRWPRTGDPGGDRRAFIEQRRRDTQQRRVRQGETA